MTDRNGKTTTFAHEGASSHVTTIADANGTTATMTEDDAQRLTLASNTTGVDSSSYVLPCTLDRLCRLTTAG